MTANHLVAALQRALLRYGTPEPAGVVSDAVPASEGAAPTPRRGVPLRRQREPGWVTIGEIEASQSPNTYPRLGRRDIRDACLRLAEAGTGPVLEVRAGKLRTWVRVRASDGAAPSSDAASTATATEATEAEVGAPEPEGTDVSHRPNADTPAGPTPATPKNGTRTPD